MPRGRSTTPRLLTSATTMNSVNNVPFDSEPFDSDPFDVSLDNCLKTFKIIDITTQLHHDSHSDDLELLAQDRQHCRDFHSWIKTRSPQAIVGLAMSECPMARRAINSDAKLPHPHSTDSPSHDETTSILKFRSFLHAARKHAASITAASAACASESEDSATNSSTSGTEDTESSDSDDEISDNEAEQLAARARSRCRRSASPSISTTAAAAHIPPPSPAPQPHIDPEGFWKRREYEWSWTPESPSPTTVKFEIPSIILTPAPSSINEQDSDVLGYTQAWTPLQSSVCPVTSVSLLTVPECFVLQSDIPMPQPECSACSDAMQLRYRRACEDETGMAAEELAALNVGDQRRRGVHGRMWPGFVGTCVCAEWKAYALACKANEDDLEAQETSEDEDSPASSPGMPCTPLSSPMELEESGESKPQTPRWMDFDEDDEELPSLDDWT